jgi:hypothetical protein
VPSHYAVAIGPASGAVRAVDLRVGPFVWVAKRNRLKNPIMPIPYQRWPLIAIDYQLRAVPLRMFSDVRSVKPRL